ncbi:MAG: hypothetical protein ACRD2Q_04960 [Terriglobales bacterium]
MKRLLYVALTLLLCGTLAGPVQADEKPKKKKKEVYSATAMGVAGVAGGRTLSLTLYINDYTTDEEAVQLAQTLKTGGSDALLKAMEKLEKGRVAVVGRTGNTVAVIRSRPLENGRRRIIMVTDRPIGFIELRQGTRSRDYEFGVIELLLDEKGKGEGVALAAAKIKFTKDNTIEFEYYGIEPVRLVNVQAF